MTKGTETEDLGSSPTRYSWSREFHRFDGRSLRLVGGDSGVVTDTRGVGGVRSTPSAGSDCTQADPASRGPEIGPVPGS